jgi:hypothetical protein
MDRDEEEGLLGGGARGARVHEQEGVAVGRAHHAAARLVLLHGAVGSLVGPGVHRDVAQVVAALVRVDAVVVGQLQREVRVLASVAAHLHRPWPRMTA